MTQSSNIRQYLQENLSSYLDILRQMVEINSFTSNSSGVNKLGDTTAKLFSKLGFQAEFIQAANPNHGKHLFLTRSPKNTNLDGAPESIAMISHLDTVFSSEEEIDNDFTWKVKGDRIYGPGTVDIKGGTVMIYAVLDAIRIHHQELYERTNWLIAIDACEESLSIDFGERCLERFPQDTRACLVFEGGTVLENEISLVTSRKGRATFHVEVEGRSAHAGNAHAQGANAIVQLARTVQNIAALTDYNRNLTFNVGTVRGGSVVNRVPHYAEAKVEMRTFRPEIFDQAVDSILSLDGSGEVSSADGYPCTVSIRMTDQNAPWPENKYTGKLFDLWSATAANLALSVVSEKRGGLSDGNMLWKHMPTMDGLGPAGGNAHCSERTPDGLKEQEYVLVSSFIPRAILNIHAILQLIK